MRERIKTYWERDSLLAHDSFSMVDFMCHCVLPKQLKLASNFRSDTKIAYKSSSTQTISSAVRTDLLSLHNEVSIKLCSKSFLDQTHLAVSLFDEESLVGSEVALTIKSASIASDSLCELIELRKQLENLALSENVSRFRTYDLLCIIISIFVATQGIFIGDPILRVFRNREILICVLWDFKRSDFQRSSVNRKKTIKFGQFGNNRIW